MNEVSDVAIYGLALTAVLFLLLGSGVWVAISLMVASCLALTLATDVPVSLIAGPEVWETVSGWTLTALPLFIWMGEILFRTRMSESLFNGIAPWVSRLPGQLLHVNVLGCGLFAAVSGSSAATVATVGQMTLPELEKRGYNTRLSLGSLAASGTLGLLIPPSITLIVYGVMAHVSVGKLFIAGVLPGLLIVTLFAGYIIIRSVLFDRVKVEEVERTTFAEKLKHSRLLIPIGLLIVLVIGSIYTGFATPTEAAMLGVLGSLGIAYLTRNLSFKILVESMRGAVRTSCMIMFIIGAAAFLNVGVAYTGIPEALASAIVKIDLSLYGLFAALAVLYVILGCFIDGASIIILSASIVVPVMKALGVDLIWFGIFLTIMIEVAQITPPVGFNLFVINAITKHDIMEIAIAVFPFFVLMMLASLLITVFPQIVTWLPAAVQ